MLDYIFHMTLNLFCKYVFGNVNILINIRDVVFDVFS